MTVHRDSTSWKVLVGKKEPQTQDSGGMDDVNERKKKHSSQAWIFDLPLETTCTTKDEVVDVHRTAHNCGIMDDFNESKKTQSSQTQPFYLPPDTPHSEGDVVDRRQVAHDCDDVHKARQHLEDHSQTQDCGGVDVNKSRTAQSSQTQPFDQLPETYHSVTQDDDVDVEEVVHDCDDIQEAHHLEIHLCETCGELGKPKHQCSSEEIDVDNHSNAQGRSTSEMKTSSGQYLNIHPCPVSDGKDVEEDLSIPDRMDVEIYTCKCDNHQNGKSRISSDLEQSLCEVCDGEMRKHKSKNIADEMDVKIKDHRNLPSDRKSVGHVRGKSIALQAPFCKSLPSSDDDVGPACQKFEPLQVDYSNLYCNDESFVPASQKTGLLPPAHRNLFSGIESLESFDGFYDTLISQEITSWEVPSQNETMQGNRYVDEVSEVPSQDQQGNRYGDEVSEVPSQHQQGNRYGHSLQNPTKRTVDSIGNLQNQDPQYLEDCRKCKVCTKALEPQGYFSKNSNDTPILNLTENLCMDCSKQGSRVVSGDEGVHMLQNIADTCNVPRKALEPQRCLDKNLEHSQKGDSLDNLFQGSRNIYFHQEVATLQNIAGQGVGKTNNHRSLQKECKLGNDSGKLSKCQKNWQLKQSLIKSSKGVNILQTCANCPSLIFTNERDLTFHEIKMKHCAYCSKYLSTNKKMRLHWKKRSSGNVFLQPRTRQDKKHEDKTKREHERDALKDMFQGSSDAYFHKEVATLQNIASQSVNKTENHKSRQKDCKPGNDTSKLSKCQRNWQRRQTLTKSSEHLDVLQTCVNCPWLSFANERDLTFHEIKMKHCADCSRHLSSNKKKRLHWDKRSSGNGFLQPRTRQDKKHEDKTKWDKKQYVESFFDDDKGHTKVERQRNVLDADIIEATSRSDCVQGELTNKKNIPFLDQQETKQDKKHGANSPHNEGKQCIELDNPIVDTDEDVIEVNGPDGVGGRYHGNVVTDGVHEVNGPDGVGRKCYGNVMTDVVYDANGREGVGCNCHGNVKTDGVHDTNGREGVGCKCHGNVLTDGVGCRCHGNVSDGVHETNGPDCVGRRYHGNVLIGGVHETNRPEDVGGNAVIDGVLWPDGVRGSVVTDGVYETNRPDGVGHRCHGNVVTDGVRSNIATGSVQGANRTDSVGHTCHGDVTDDVQGANKPDGVGHNAETGVIIATGPSYLKSECHQNWHSRLTQNHDKLSTFTPYECVKCSSHFQSSADLFVHELAKLHCAFCKESFPSTETCVAHWSKRSSYYVNPVNSNIYCDLKCKVCGYPTSNIKCHEIWHHRLASPNPQNPRYCCLTAFSTVEELIGHEVYENHCAYCTTKFSSNYELISHWMERSFLDKNQYRWKLLISQAEPGLYTVNENDFAKRKKHGSVPPPRKKYSMTTKYNCQQCPYLKMKSECQLNFHILKMHKQGSLYLTCKNCKVKINKNEVMKHEIATNHCVFCTEVFQTRQALAWHWKAKIDFGPSNE